MLPVKWGIAGHFLRAHARFRLRGPALERFQDRRARQMMEFARRHSPYYRQRLEGYAANEWRRLPPIGKAEMMAHFGAFNTRGISREAAMEAALHAEKSRDFQPTIQGVTVGLSSGTSGHRGLFLVHPAEQAAWVGVMLARALPGLRPQGYRVAFFLRSNSNLYESLGSKWLRFRYFDLMTPLEEAVAQLNAYRPDILVGPPSLLGFLAEAQDSGWLRIAPRKVISVAEVLEPQDRQRISASFHIPVVHQIYQCTEGLLAVTCPHGGLHIQEDLVALEMEPLPGQASPERFSPIVTDLWRVTQPILRYRLNDVLTLDPSECPCGSAFRKIACIEGRCDDVFHFVPDAGGTGTGVSETGRIRTGGLRPFFPDTIRRMVLLADGRIRDYQALQARPGALRLHLEIDPEADFAAVAEAVRTCVAETLAQYGCRPARLCIERGLEPLPPGQKRRRVQRTEP